MSVRDDLPFDVIIRGSQTEKVYRAGTERVCSPDETLARVRPFFDVFGITRVANITGLDRLGIPVIMVVRPNSRGLAVAQGKGIDVAQARASGVMEAIEQAHSESVTCAIRLESFHVLRRTQCVADPASLPLSRHSTFHPLHVLPWAEARDIATGQPFWVPFELVHANATLPLMPGSGAFVRSTNGLASGNNLAEAVLHGIYEIVERDAIALWDLRSESEQAKTRIDLSTVQDPINRALLDRYEAADFSVMVWDVASDTRIPAFRCVIVDRRAHARYLPLPAAFGSGCHLDPAMALTRSLTEAAQSRLTCIAGARDDLSRERYRLFQSQEALASQRKRSEEPGVVDMQVHRSAVGETLEEDLKMLHGRLGDAGFENILFIDLSRASLPVFVVRVIIPGMEGATESADYRPGVRARSLFG